MTIGTPGQLVEVDFDTGSSELWVNPTCANTFYPAGCTTNGLYNSALSSTSVNLGTPFSISYGIGSVAGTYVIDIVRAGTASLAKTQFGTATTSQQMMQGILGVGLGNGFLTMNYNSLIDQLWSQGAIASRAFSVDLASIDVAQGPMIFGAIDTMKYSGSLQKLPIISYTAAPQNYPRYWINLNGFGITPPGAGSSTLLTAIGSVITLIPDSGSTLSYLPPGLVTAMLAYFPGAALSGGAYTVSCAFRTQVGSLQVVFGGTTINISYHEFIWFDGVQCWLGTIPASAPYIIGDSFMRSAYSKFGSI